MSNRYKTLIHTALYPEAKPLIHYFNLIHNKSYDKYRIYENDKYILVVSGMGETNVNKVLPFIYDNFKINKAVNIGIAGCKDKSIKLGSLFCTNHNLKDIKTTTLTSVNAPLDDESKLTTILVDMEAESFFEISKNNLNEKDIFVFKVVSDHLSKKIPDKSLVYNSIKNSIAKWESVI
mgnify:CR=1 FL=1